MLLAVDVGNTATGLALFNGERLVFRNKLATPRRINSRFWDKILGKHRIKKVSSIIISSVVPPVEPTLSNSCIEIFSCKPVFIDHTADIDLKIKIDSPGELGADRIADAVGAISLVDPPVMVIDSGTATTFDIINRQYEYLGGAIFPGITLGIDSLAKKAAKLEKIEFKKPVSILGTNTGESIRAGIYFSYIGGLSYMIEEYKKIIGREAKVIATGGLSPTFKGKIQGIDRFEPDLIFLGLKRIAERVLRD
jgi:type III pantothenate kinase